MGAAAASPLFRKVVQLLMFTVKLRYYLWLKPLTIYIVSKYESFTVNIKSCTTFQRKDDTAAAPPIDDQSFTVVQRADSGEANWQQRFSNNLLSVKWIDASSPGGHARDFRKTAALHLFAPSLYAPQFPVLYDFSGAAKFKTIFPCSLGPMTFSQILCERLKNITYHSFR